MRELPTPCNACDNHNDETYETICMDCKHFYGSQYIKKIVDSVLKEKAKQWRRYSES